MRRLLLFAFALALHAQVQNIPDTTFPVVRSLMNSNFGWLGTNKEPTIAAGTTAQYWRGDKSWQSLATGTYALFSATSPLSFNSSTGAFSCASCITSNAVTSVFGRTGAVTATANDYSFSQISGSVAAGQMPGLTGDVGSTAGTVATTLATVNSSPGACGDATHVCQPTTNGKGLVTAQAAVAITTPHAIGYAFDGGGSALTTRASVPITVTFACTINAWNLDVDAGTATIKILKIATGTAIPTTTSSINTSGVAISTGTAIHSTTLTDFTTLAVSANDIVIVQLSAVATATQVGFTLGCQ